jgi:hypothetical protein
VTVFAGEIDEGLVLLDDPSDGTTTKYSVALTDGVRLSHQLLGAYVLALTSGIIVSGTPSYKWIAGAAISENAKFGHHVFPHMVYGITLADQVTLAAALNVAWSVQMHERITLAQTEVVIQALTLIDKVILHGHLSPSMIYGVQLIQRILLDEDFGAFYSMVIAEHATLTGTPHSQYIAVASLLDGSILNDVLASTVTFMVTLEDDVVLSDDAVVQMIFSGTIHDHVIIKALYVAPDGNYTTWTVNTRTNAVTEYRNFAFNSFAQVGRKYLGASNEGLFELNGERDGTTNIVARIGGGFVEFNGSRLAGLQGIYIGMRGQGQYFLKIVTGDGLDRVYKVKAQPQFMTTKVNTGKGFRSRYFSWELEGTGSDFDFDSIEFVPLTFGRRV